MPITIETFQDFAARNGDDSVEVGNRLIFSNGAQSNPQGTAFQEAPAELSVRLALQKKRMQELVRRAREDFFNTRPDYSEMCSNASHYDNLPFPDRAAVEHLEQLQRIAQQRQAELEKIERQISETPAGKARQQRAEVGRKRHEQIAAVHQQITSLTLDNEPPAREPDAAIREAAARESKLLGDALSRAAGIKPCKED